MTEEALIERVSHRAQQPHRRKALVLVTLVVVLLLGGRVLWREAQFTRLRQPLIQAVRAGDTERVRALLDQGADPDTPVQERFLPFSWAGMLRALRLGQSDRAQQKYTVLMEAASKNQAKSVRFLLDKGALVNRKDGSNMQWTALHYAADYGALESMKTLIEAGADVQARDAFGSTPLHCVVSPTTRMHVGEWDDTRTRCVDLLLRQGADANARDQYGRPPLMCVLVEAAAFDSIDVRPPMWQQTRERVQLLIAHGADVQAKDTSGVTALEMAEGMRNHPVEMLLKAAVHPVSRTGKATGR